jgi:hypothetical protein
MNVNVMKDFSIMAMTKIVRPAIHFAKIAAVIRIVIVYSAMLRIIESLKYLPAFVS